MWVFTQTGYISVVDYHQKPGYLTARSRDRQSLEPLREIADSTIDFTPMRDYQYRTLIKREDLQTFLTQQVEAIDYSNFKDRVSDVLGSDFHHACGDVWVAMNAIKDDEAQEWYAERYARYAETRNKRRVKA